MARDAIVPPRPRTYRAADPWFLAGAALIAVQLGGVVPAVGGLDIISVFMMLLALLCTAKTVAVLPPRGSPERWRLWAASIGWALWSAHWAAGAAEPTFLAEGQVPVKLLVPAHRVAFIVALAPLAASGDGRVLRLLDIALGVVLASLLAILSWPELLRGVNDGPNTTYLYLGYAAMAALAAVSMAVQSSATLRALAVSMFWTLLLYGVSALLLRELYAHGAISIDSPVFVIGDAAFLAYLFFLPRVSRLAAPAAADESSADREGSIVLDRLVPLLLATLILALAFVVERRQPFVGMAVGLSGAFAYAVRVAMVEQARHRSQRATLAAERARSQAVVDMMHEVRSPLGSVMLNAGLLQRSASLGEKDRAVCGAIERGCLYVHELLEDVLTLERLEAGLVRAAMEDCDLSRILEDAAEQLAPRAEGCGVRILLPEDGIRVRGTVDAAGLRRIVLNLMTNAIRFTPRGGRLEAKAWRRADGAACIVIADDGVGMSPAETARLFQRFALAGEPVHGRRGAGLGLSISLGLARAMGGTIEVVSRPGEGTTMTVIVPIGRPVSRNYTDV